MTQFSEPTRRHCKYMICAVAVAISSMSTQTAAQDAGVHRAVITIPNPRTANLLQLRGLGGRGTAHIQIGETCHSLPVRFVAGDFSGESITVRRTGPIVIELRDSQTVAGLLNGADILSDENAGIVIHSGLSAETGFVINPGSNISADLFGARAVDRPCDARDDSPTPETGG